MDRFINFAVGLALNMSRRKPRLAAFERTRRFALEKALQQRRYCDAFALWRTCRHRICRRRRACSGDADFCLREGLHRVPRELQQRVHGEIFAATPDNFGAPEREARQYTPAEFYRKR